MVLLQSGRAQTSASLAGACGVSRRTIFRDLNVLRDAGVSLVYREEDQSYWIPSPSYLPPTSFTPDEALAMMVLCQQLGEASGLPFYGSARRAALKLESNLPQKLRDYLRDVTSAVSIKIPQINPLDEHQSTYDQLVAAIGARRAVRIRYDSFTEWKIIATKLYPYRLLFSRRSWYVIGRSSLHRGVRTFNLGRIVNLEPLDQSYRVPRSFSVERYLRNAWHLIPEPGPDRKVVVRFQPMVAGNVAEVLWHKTQELRFNRDGTLDFSVTVSGLNEISWWILGYGHLAEVLEPVELRQLIGQHAARMHSIYSESDMAATTDGEGGIDGENIAPRRAKSGGKTTRNAGRAARA